MEATPGTTEPGVNGFVTYSNSEHLLTFNYPSTYTITEESVQVAYDNGTEWFRVTLENEDGDSFYVEVNQDGYGPFFPDVRFSLTVDENDKVSNITEEIQEVSELNDDDFASFTASTNQAQPSCFVVYRAEGEVDDHIDEFRSVLQSLEFK